jgi:hypothetical protein
VAVITHTRPEIHAVPYETCGICLTRGILIIKISKITIIIIIIGIYNGREGDEMVVAARTY